MRNSETTSCQHGAVASAKSPPTDLPSPAVAPSSDATQTAPATSRPRMSGHSVSNPGDRVYFLKMFYYVVNATAWIPVTVYLVFLLYPWFQPGSFIVSETVDRLIVWFNYQLSLFSLVYVTMETFRLYANKQGTLLNELSRNSYYVYIIHVIVMGVIATLTLDAAIPSLLKYLLLAISTFVMSNLIVSVFRHLPGATARAAGYST